jgi:hypothetical protein
VEPDGIVFDPSTVVGELIKEEADYQGVRVDFLGFLGKAKINMRLDVGFADVVTPAPKDIEIPTILENICKPCIRAYPPETVIAEKFQALVSLGMINSRMKDFYDLWYLANLMEFDFNLLHEAISNTFKQRNMLMQKEIPITLTPEFAAQKQIQWASFLKKNQLHHAPAILFDVNQTLIIFFTPIIHPLEKTYTKWSPKIGWME